MVLAVAIEAHECPKCGALWPTTQGALDCCDSWVRLTPAFRCNHCGLIFPDSQSADDCCQALDVVYVIIRDRDRQSP